MHKKRFLDLPDFLIQKPRLYNRAKEKLCHVQEKGVARMFREGPEGFKGRLTAENYLNISVLLPM